MLRIKCVCSEPPCCFGVFSDILSVYDNFGDEDQDLKSYFTGKSEDIPYLDPREVQDAKRVSCGIKSGS